jgi:hypothetical protein
MSAGSTRADLARALWARGLHPLQRLVHYARQTSQALAAELACTEAEASAELAELRRTIARFDGVATRH